MLLKLIILNAQQKMGNERSVSGLFHILQGKSSIQTIQDTHLFGLEELYGVHKQMNREQFFNLIEALHNAGLLDKYNEQQYLVSDLGISWLCTQDKLAQHIFLNGKKYNKIDRVLFNRIQLLIQVWTNAKKANFNFIPIIENRKTANWVKQFYTLTKDKLDIYLYHLYEELNSLFTPLPIYFPEIFLNQLSAYKHIGKTMEQLALQYGATREEIAILTTNVIHYLLYTVDKNKTEYPLLHTITKELYIPPHITASAQMTKYYLNQGYSLHEIAVKRALKVNTIYDHLVEMAVHDPDFPIEQYVRADTFETIKNASKKLATFKLKTLKDAIDEDVSYFQIRLVLAMLGHDSMAEVRVDQLK